MTTVSVIGPQRPLLPVIVRRLTDSPGIDRVVVGRVGGAETVVHVAGADDEEWLHDPGARAEETVRRTRDTLEAAAAGRVRALVHVSSATVYGAWPDNPVPLPEDAPLRPNPGFGYARAQAEAERLVAEWGEEHPDVAVSVLRPAIVMGGDGRSWMSRVVGGIGTPKSSDATRPLQFVHADDVASAVALAVTDDLRGVFNVAPDGWVPDETARALAGGVARVSLPGWLARPLSRLGWILRGRGTPAGAVPWVTHPWVVANDRLRRAGWQPSHTNEEAFVVAEPASAMATAVGRHRQEISLVAAVALIAGLVIGIVALVVRGRRRGSRPTRGSWAGPPA
jgi:nucleoside-diphosphate-sugar epimerase